MTLSVRVDRASFNRQEFEITLFVRVKMTLSVLVVDRQNLKLTLYVCVGRLTDNLYIRVKDKFNSHFTDNVFSNIDPIRS
jgi:hypothetical protein